MAFRTQRLFCFLRAKSIKCKLLDLPKLQSTLGSSGVQIAHLTSTHGEPAQRPKPWPYEKRPYNIYWQFIDHTRKRFDDNSKVIVVDGNLAVGKSEFGEKIAKEFDMKFISDVPEDDLFTTPAGLDLRELDEQLPPGARNCDFHTFYSQNAPKAQLAKIGKTQLNMYNNRFHKYACALEHVLNTGQGVVIERGPWSDAVFADALRKFGHITSQGHSYYYKMRDNTICELWKPHLIIYLDAPISHIRQQIKKRNFPHEVDSKVLTDEYLQSIDDSYKKKVLPLLRKNSEVLTYDATDLPDWEIIYEDLENLNLDMAPEDNEEQYGDWTKKREDDWNHYRAILACKWQLQNLFNLPLPWEAPEMMLSGEDYMEYQKIVESHPDVKYMPGYNPEKYNVLFKV